MTTTFRDNIPLAQLVLRIVTGKQDLEITKPEQDFFGKGKAFYRIERINMDTNEPFNDGEHILYVNGEYRDDSDIGKLMHDFSCWNPEDMNFDLMREATKYYKENPEGVEFMCRAFEETRNEGIEKGREQAYLENIRSMMETLKLTSQQAMDALKIPVTEQAKYVTKL